jgi:HEPN domain-containing protein
LEALGIDIPEAVDQATLLTRYAVETRYPGAYEPVTEEEYREAIRCAETILSWVTTTP